MLQSNMTQTGRNQPPLTSGEAGIGEMISFALGVLRRRYATIFVTTALALSLASLYLYITPPAYKAQTQILLKNSKAQFVKQESPLAEPAFDLTEIETQIQIVKSSAIAIAVIKQLNLTADPDLNRSSPSLPSDWSAIHDEGSPPAAETRRREPEEPLQGLIDAFEHRLDAERVGFSNIIEINYSSSSPARAAEIANAIANAYVNDQSNSKLEANRRAVDWLQDRLEKLAAQTRDAERAVDAYKAQHNIVSSGGKPIDEQQVSDFNTRLVAARAQTADALARLNRNESLLRADSRDGASAETTGDAISDAMQSPIINNLRSEYLELQRKESEWSDRFGQNHGAVVELRTQMRNIRKSIRNEVQRLAEASRSDYETAKARQQEIEKQLYDVVASSRVTNAAEVALRELESQAKGDRNLFETFQQRYMSAAQQASFPIDEARVIYPALPPDSKSKPKTVLIMALALFGGLGLGGALALLKELMDRAFRTPTQVETALELPCLSVVPWMSAPKKRRVAGIDAPDPYGGDPQRVLSPRHSIDSTVVGMPMSRFAETIRSTKMGIDLNPTKTANQVIGVTSALPGEGKTTIAASLARLIAHSGKRAIVVDCDLRNPSLSASLAPNATVGIIEAIYGATPLEDVIWRDPTIGFTFLPAVRRRPLFHTAEMLASNEAHGLFDRLRKDYDYVIVDLPPLAPIVDARAAASFSDCFILVIEWGRTKIDVVQHALHNAPEIHENLAGAVLNKTDVRAMASYNPYHDDYYNDSHYARYRSAQRT